MKAGTISCPDCGHEFEISEALSGDIREHLKEELQEDVQKRETALKEKQATLKAEKGKLEKKLQSFEDELEKATEEQLEQVEARASKKAKASFELELKDLKETLDDQDESLKELRNKEVGLLKQKRELETKMAEADLEIERTLNEERQKITDEVSKRVTEDTRLKALEKDEKINQLSKLLDEAQRKAAQGSMETQGEALELDIEAKLKATFNHDDISPVSKGVKGADLIQLVKTSFGEDAGIILWETKNTKAWSNQWISKLKDDMIEQRATFAILVSVTLPDDIKHFGLKEGVWVSDPISAIPLATALRMQLIDLHRERKASVGKNEKMEAVYQYLTGSEFKQKIEGIVDAFTGMQDQITKERRAMEKQWKEREKMVERVIKNTVGLYGDMQGIIGGQIPEILALELSEPVALIEDGE